MNVIITAGWGYPYKKHATNTKSEFIALGLKNAGVEVLFMDALWGTSSINHVSYGVSETGLDYVSFPRKYGVLSIVPNFFHAAKIMHERKQNHSPNVLLDLYGIPSILIALLLLFLSFVFSYKKCMIYHEYAQSFKKKHFYERIASKLYDKVIPKFVDCIHPISHYITDWCLHFKKPLLPIPILGSYDKIIESSFSNEFTYCVSASYFLRNEIIIKAFEIASKQDVRFRVNLVLSQLGDMMKDVQLLLKEHELTNICKVNCDLSQNDLYSLFASSLALLIPLDPNSLQDKARFSQKIAEYISTGRPIITSNVGEIPYYFKHNESAIIVDYDAKSYAEAFVYLLDNKRVADRVGKGGFKVGREFFDYKKNGLNIVKFYEQIFK